MHRTKVKGLPFQGVQFQMMAAQMRAIMDSDSISSKTKLIKIIEKEKQLIEAAMANALFWKKQLEANIAIEEHMQTLQ